jgi:hypothetical protein
MEYLLVLQLPGSSMRPHDEVLRIERRVGVALGGLAVVDGHQQSSGEIDILVLTERPIEVLQRINELPEGWEVVPALRAAYRKVDDDDFEVLDGAGPRRFRIVPFAAGA